MRVEKRRGGRFREAGSVRFFSEGIANIGANSTILRLYLASGCGTLSFVVAAVTAPMKPNGSPEKSAVNQLIWKNDWVARRLRIWYDSLPGSTRTNGGRAGKLYSCRAVTMCGILIFAVVDVLNNAMSAKP